MFDAQAPRGGGEWCFAFGGVRRVVANERALGRDNRAVRIDGTLLHGRVGGQLRARPTRVSLSDCPRPVGKLRMGHMLSTSA